MFERVLALREIAGDLRFGGIEWVRELGNTVTTVLADLRRRVGHSGEARIAEELGAAFRAARLTPKQLVAIPSALKGLKTK